MYALITSIQLHTHIPSQIEYQHSYSILLQTKQQYILTIRISHSLSSKLNDAIKNNN